MQKLSLARQNATMRSTRFTVPAADRFENPSVETRPAKVRAWVERLPYANREGVIDTVIESLSLLNRHPSAIGSRLELMELYRIPSGHLVRMTPDQIGAPSFGQLRKLVAEMAYGYKHVINECLLQKSWLSNRKKLLTSIYFGVKYLSLDLLMGYECYQCKSDHTWRELMPLYRLAERQNLHLVEVNDPDQSKPEFSTISHLMKRIVLLSLLDPCRLPPGEARTSYDYLNLGASLTRLEPLTKPNDMAGRFLLDTEGIRPARPYDPDDIPSDPSRYRLLNLVPVSKQAHLHLRRLEIDDTLPPGALQTVRNIDATQILSRMLKAWHARQERGSPRQDTFGWVTIAGGLGRINRFLKDCQSNTAGRPGTALEGVRCRRLNVSETGIALRLQLPIVQEPKVGQLLVMQDGTDRNKSTVTAGIIRRCLRIDDETMELGIQYMRGRLQPVSFRPVLADSMENRYLLGVLINDPGDQTDSLLVPRGLYEEGREFLMEDANPAPLVTAVRLIESGPDFDRFHLHSPQQDWAS